MSVEVDDRGEVIRAETRDLLIDARPEPPDVHVHPPHVVYALKAIGHFDRATGPRRRRQEHAGLLDRFAEERRKTV